MGCFDCEKPLQEDFLLNVFHFFFFFFPRSSSQHKPGVDFPGRAYVSPPPPPDANHFADVAARAQRRRSRHSFPRRIGAAKKKKESTSARIKACRRPAAQHENTTSWSSVGGPAVIVSCQTSKVLPHSFAPDILLPFIYFFFPPFAGILAAAPLVTKFSSFPPTVVHRAAVMEEAWRGSCTF